MPCKLESGYMLARMGLVNFLWLLDLQFINVKEGMVIEKKNKDETAKGSERLRICALLLKLKRLKSELYNGFQVYKCCFSVTKVFGNTHHPLFLLDD